MSFSDFNLDDRLLKAIADLGWSCPTLIQEKFIPLVLEGKDIVARARTGSGKTAAFAIPIIQKILEYKMSSNSQCTRAILLAPTKELSSQLVSHITTLCSACSMEVRSLDISAVKELKTQMALLGDQPDILVGTPSRILPHMQACAQKLRFLVMDEADLLFSFGYEADLRMLTDESACRFAIALLRQLLSSLPPACQCLLTSATMTDDVKSLKNLALTNPVTLKLNESRLPDGAQLTQYHIKCNDEDKFVLLCALLKLRLVRGKTLIFVASTDRCYRLRLFLEQFDIHSCVLNSEMPVNSRCHIVREYNDDKYDYVIASDLTNMNDDDTREEAGMKRRRKRRKMDKESGVSRGIDFHRVANVINFDFPKSVDVYIHRVGRTARGWNKGTALSFATKSDENVLEQVACELNDQMDGDVLKPYEFRMDELDGFRYRARDVLNAVTCMAVREARLAEIKAEAIRSRKLAGYFGRNPREMSILGHDDKLRGVNVHSVAIADVPDYIVPPALRGLNYGAPLGPTTKRNKKTRHSKLTAGQKKYHKKKCDPLQSFKI